MLIYGPHPTPQKKRAHIDTGIIAVVTVNGTNEVQVSGLGWHNQTLTLSQTCLKSLNWPVMKSVSLMLTIDSTADDR
jgi:hypothetical protein